MQAKLVHAERILVSITAAAMMLSASSVARTQTVVRDGSVEAEPGPAANFTGRVAVRMLTDPTPPGQAGTAMVSFSPGARSNWHTHPAGQTLYVTAGCGWTQEEGGAVARICRGDTVYVKPGVRHWHGATATTGMSHLAISETLDGKNVTWLAPVTAAQFSGPAR